jgi:hypothetical protein
MNARPCSISIGEPPRDLTLVLVAASVTSALRDEINRMGWTVTPLGDGYGRIDGGVYATYLVITDEIAPAERDDFLAIFSHHRATDPAAVRWFQQWFAEGTMTHNIQQLEDYKEVLQKLMESLSPAERLAGLAPEERLAGLAPKERVAGLAPEERLAGLTPEERVAGLAPEQIVLTLPVEALRSLSDEYLQSLKPEVAEQIRKRIAR